MVNNDLSILCISCDKNLVIFNNFANFFNINWKDCEYEKYVLLEQNINNSISGFKIINQTGDFSYRLIKALENIHTPYVLLLLDDFFIENLVESKCVNEFLETMIRDKTIANIGFSNFNKEIFKSDSGDLLFLREKEKFSLLNFQAGIWKISVLKELLKKGEDPWYAEWYGTQRARRTLNKFYGLCKNVSSPIEYSKGWVVVRGSWNLSEVRRISNKTGIKINLGDLPQQENIVDIPMSFLQKIIVKIRISFMRFKMLFRRKVLL